MESIHEISSCCAGCGGRHILMKCPFRKATAIPVVGLATYVEYAAVTVVPGHQSLRRASDGRVNQIVSVVSPQEIHGSCQFEIDSCSPVTIMKDSSHRFIGASGSPVSKLSDYQLYPIPVKGITETRIRYNNPCISNRPLIATSGQTGLNRSESA